MGRTNCNGTSGDAEAKAETELYYNSLAKAESMLAPFCLSVDVGPTPTGCVYLVNVIRRSYQLIRMSNLGIQVRQLVRKN